MASSSEAAGSRAGVAEGSRREARAFLAGAAEGALVGRFRVAPVGLTGMIARRRGVLAGCLLVGVGVARLELEPSRSGRREAAGPSRYINKRDGAVGV